MFIQWLKLNELIIFVVSAFPTANVVSFRVTDLVRCLLASRIVLQSIIVLVNEFSHFVNGSIRRKLSAILTIRIRKFYFYHYLQVQET